MASLKNIWLKEVQCREVVDACWRNFVGLYLPTRIELCRKEIDRWGRGITKNFQNEIERCKYRMSELRERYYTKGIHKFAQAQREYIHLVEQHNG